MTKRVVSFIMALLVFFSIISFVNIKSLQSMTIPTVALSNYSPGASDVSYKITFTTDAAHALSAGDWVEIREFHVFNMPTPSFGTPNMIQVNGYDAINGSWANADLQSADPNDYLVHIRIPDQITSPVTSITIVFSSTVGLKNPSLQTTWTSSSHFDNNPAKNEWRLKIRTSRESNDIWSSPYNISIPSVSDVTVNVSPNVVSVIASYDITFKTGTSGELHGGESKIIIEFPSGTLLPNTIPANSIIVKVGNYQGNPPADVKPSGEIVEVTMPDALYAGDNTVVHVVFSVKAGIRNPANASNLYQIKLKTSSEDNFVESSYYSISPSTVSNVSVVVTPNVVSSIASYVISFNLSSVGSLSKNNSFIFVVFPNGTIVPSDIPLHSVLVNNVPSLSCDTISNNTVKIGVPISIAGDSKVNVSFSSLAGIRNPSAPGNDYKVIVYTTNDPGKAISNAYSITESHISPASVRVSPDIVNVNASYIILFSIGSDGALSAGDKIYITFPEGTLIPSNISAQTVTVNGTSCTHSPLIAGRKVTIFVPQFIPNNSSILLVFQPSAGIKNPSIPKNNYRLIISTSSEHSLVNSMPYTIKDTVHSSIVVTPQKPDGKNGYYISEPKVKIIVSNPSNLTYSIYYKLDNGEFHKYQTNAYITIPNGTHTLYYYAEDSFGNKENVKTSIFRVSLSNPLLTITSPKDGAKFHTNAVIITGKTTPGCVLTINNVNVNIDKDGNFSYSYIFPKEGTYTLVIRSENQAGNFSEKKIHLTYIKQIRIMLQVGNKHCYVNDEDYYLDATPYINHGRVMVPVRFISETFGFSVQWDPIFKIISIYASDQRRIRLQVNNTIADLFGKAVKLDAPPVIKDGRTFVPLRFISESFGADVEWDPKLQIVKIIYPRG